ncbi:MAG: DUF624 domain-containing protein [Clostridiales bacterium]|nr:DUF624 domain-containing protein [Clostridiales bacterium]
MDQQANNSNPSGKSTSVFSKLGVIVLLSSCFVLGSLLVVTFGVSCTALYYAINKRYKDHSETPAADFFRSYRENLLQGIILTVFLICYLGGAGFFLYYSLFGLNKTPPPGWCLPVAVFLLIPTFFVTMFTFPYLARFKNTVKGTIFHSFTFSMMYLGHNVTMWLLFLASVALVILFPPFVLVVPFACGFLCWKLCEPDFNYARLLKDKRENPDKYKTEQPEEEEEDEYEDDDEDESEDGEEDESEEYDEDDEDSDEDSDEDPDEDDNDEEYEEDEE